MVRALYTATLVAALAATAPAHAAVATLSATYDSFLQDTVFTVTNTGTVSEAVRLTTSLASPTSETLANLAVGMSETYTFNAQRGGFIDNPASAGIPDTTTYALLIGLNNATPTLSSGAFSPISNLTGSDVDFLGNQCNGFSGPGNNGGTCGGAGSTYLLSGTVAAVNAPTAVPEPLSITIMLVGMAGLTLAIRRRT